MKKIKGLTAIVLALVIITGGILFAQDDKTEPSSDKADKTESSSNKEGDRTSFILDDEAKVIGKDVSDSLYRITLDTFENAGEWYATMPNDQGIIVARRQKGVPKPLQIKGGSKSINEKVKKNPPKYRNVDGTYRKDYPVPYKDERKYVLGVRVDFQRRGNNWFAVYPYRPIHIEGIVKTFEVWVAGRQKNHELLLLVQDIYGEDKLISMGKLNFLGWKRLFVNIPDQIVQYDYKFTTRRGLVFKGFVVQCNSLESWGKYYIYFDNLVAEVSRFWEEYQDENDPSDIW